MTSTDATMPAWTQRDYGPASAVRLSEIAAPAPGAGEVLLKVHATALNAGDVRVMLGDPLLVRPVFGFTRPRIPVRGMDVAGVVVAVGDGVSDAEVGDEVVAELPGGGGLAPIALAPAARLSRRPENVSPVVAATLPIAGGTAWQALDLARVGEGSRVLIIGASGGVGTFAVQLASLRGAEVHASCGARAHELVGSLGAERVLDRDLDPADLPADGYDAVIQLAGGQPLRGLRRLVRPGGTVVLVGGDGGRVLGPIPRMLAAAVLSVGSRRSIRFLSAAANAGILAQLLELADAGRLRPVIDREYPFAGADDALAHLEAGHTVGKVVVLAAS